MVLYEVNLEASCGIKDASVVVTRHSLEKESLGILNSVRTFLDSLVDDEYLQLQASIHTMDNENISNDSVIVFNCKHSTKLLYLIQSVFPISQ